MTTTISRGYRFESAHRLLRVPDGHKCGRLHGHSYRCTVTVGGDVDPTMGWICDFAEIDAAFRPVHALLDHRYLNEIDGLENPTSETIARFIFERLELPGLVSVTIQETCVSSCTYTGPAT